jgi:hypothetical protein
VLLISTPTTLWQKLLVSRAILIRKMGNSGHKLHPHHFSRSNRIDIVKLRRLSTSFVRHFMLRSFLFELKNVSTHKACMILLHVSYNSFCSSLGWIDRIDFEGQMCDKTRGFVYVQINKHKLSMKEYDYVIYISLIDQ